MPRRLAFSLAATLFAATTLVAQAPQRAIDATQLLADLEGTLGR